MRSKRYIIALCLVLSSLLCLGAIVHSVDLLQQAMPGSSAGQPLVSTGATTAPAFAGNISLSVVTKVAGDSPYTVGATDFAIDWDATGGNSVVTIPDATGSGRLLVVSKIDSTANTVSLTPAGGSTIDGAATQVLAVPGPMMIQDVAADTWRTRN